MKHIHDPVRTVCYLLHKTPLMKEGVLAPATLTMEDLGDFADVMLENKAKIENVLHVEVRADLSAKPMSQLNQVLRLIGLSCKQLPKKKIKGRITAPTCWMRSRTRECCA